MASATFEDHPTDPDKMILRKPRLDQGADYERGFIDGMQKQMQSSVDKAVNAMSQRTEQEPVAWMKPDVLCDRACMYLCTKGFTQFPECATIYPPQRTWVGLTDEEVESYWDWEDFQCGCGRGTLLDMVRDIEAKLKEKNT
jgi:hypothetical protein